MIHLQESGMLSSKYKWPKRWTERILNICSWASMV